jgi:hypothetical protein
MPRGDNTEEKKSFQTSTRDTHKRALEMIERAKDLPVDTDRRLEVLAALTIMLDKTKLNPILVGGAAVECYANEFSTGDMDVLLPRDARVDRALEVLGFKRKGRHWANEELKLLIEFPGDYLDEGWETIEIEAPSGVMVPVASVEDLIIDRLHSFHSTGHIESLEQVFSLLDHDLVDKERLKQRLSEEGIADVAKVALDIKARKEAGENIDTGLIHELHKTLSDTI